MAHSGIISPELNMTHVCLYMCEFTHHIQKLRYTSMRDISIHSIPIRHQQRMMLRNTELIRLGHNLSHKTHYTFYDAIEEFKSMMHAMSYRLIVDNILMSRPMRTKLNAFYTDFKSHIRMYNSVYNLYAAANACFFALCKEEQAYNSNLLVVHSRATLDQVLPISGVSDCVIDIILSGLLHHDTQFRVSITYEDELTNCVCVGARSNV